MSDRAHAGPATSDPSAASPGRSRDERRRQLLEVGARLFATRGFDEVPIDEIAAAAGMSRGLLYHYFPSKQAFHLAVVERTLDEVRSLLTPDPDLAPELALDGVLDRFFGYVSEHEAGLRAIAQGRTGASARLQALLEAFREGTVDQVLGALEDTGTSPSPTLRTVLRGWAGAVEGLAVGWVLHGDPSAADERAILTALSRDLLTACLVRAGVTPP